jgi:hypothetical protein
VLADDELAVRWGEAGRAAAAASFAPVRVTERVREIHDRVVAAAGRR